DADGNGSAGPARRWESMNGNLRVSEILSAAYDPVNNVVFAGMQDNGSNAQAGGLGAWVDANGDGLPDDAATRFAWSQVLGGDGNTQQAVVIDLNSDGLDNDGINGPDDGNEFRVERFSLANNWGFFDAGADGIPGNADDVFYGVYRAALYDAAGNLISSTDRGLFAPGAGPDGVLGTFDDTQTGRPGSGLTDPADAGFSGFWPIPYVGNAVDPNRMIIGLFGLYVSPNRLSTISNIFNSGLGAGADVTVPGNTFTALAYGGREGATLKPDVIYAARGSQILVRETNSTGTQADFTTRPVPGASEIRGVAIDPDDWRIAYAVDKDKVYKTSDAGAHWDVISDRLGATDLKTVTVAKTAGGDKALLVGAQLGVYRALNPVVDVEWTELGSGLPNALVRDIDFALQPASGSGVLLAGTQGRGAWITAGDARTILGDPGSLVIGGTSGDDTVLITRDGSNASLLDIYVNSALPVFSLPVDSLSSIAFAGSDGADTLTVDSSFGPISLPGGIHFDGGDGTDTLILDGGKVVSDTQTTDAGVTQVQTVDYASGATQLVSYENVETFTDNLPQASDLETIGSGLGDFFDWLDHLSDPGEGADQSLAALGTSLLRALITGPVEPAAEPEGGPQTAGEGPGAGMDSLEGLRRLIETGTGAFELGGIGGAGIATYDALRDALDALDATGGNVSYTQVGDTTTFTAQVVKTLDGTADLDVGFDLFGGRVDLHGTMDIGADVEVNLQFGFDSQGFFVDTGASGQELLVHNITLDGDAEAAGRFGFLDVEAGVDSLTFDGDVQLAVDLQEPGGDGKLRLSDLGTSLGSKIAVNVQGDASADDVTLVASMHAAAIIPGIDAIDLGDAQVTVAWADVTQPGGVDVSASAGLGQDLLNFLRVDAQQFINQLHQVDQLAHTLNVDIPFLSDAFDQVVGFIDAFNTQVIQPLTSPVSGGASFSSVQNLAMRLAHGLGVDPAALGLDFDAASKELTYHLHLAKDFSASAPLGSAVDFGNGLGGLEFGTDASVDGSFALDLDFGVDIGAIASAADPLDWFFIRDPHAVATLDVAASDVTAGAHFGFLGVSVEGGSVSASPTLDVVLNDPGTNAMDGRIDLRELLDGLSSPGTLVSATLGGAASASLPIIVDVGLGGFVDPNVGTVQFGATDLFDTGTYTINFDGDFSDVFQFNDLSATQVLSMIGQLTSQIDALRGAPLMQTALGLPVVGPAIDEILDFGQFVHDKLLYDSVNDIPKLLDADSNPTFSTVQEFAEKLATILGLDPSVIGAHYDAATKLLTFHLNFEQTLLGVSAPLSLGFDLAEGLADFNASTDASIDANVAFDFGFGVDLNYDPSGGDDLADFVFVDDATISGSMDLTAENIDASARFGFLAIEIVDGSAAAHADFSLALNDPGTVAADGRIAISELIAGVSDLGTLVSASFAASANVSLPLSVPFLGVSPGPTTTLGLDWTDLTNPDTLTVQLPTGFADLGNFTHMDAGTLVSLLGQITNWLDSFRQGFSGTDIPFVGDALDQVLKFADLFQNTLLFDDGGDG
ncbi:MAG TPA: hypothetical protein VF183_03360, partial [Acidimicrobiales bacterium]